MQKERQCVIYNMEGQETNVKSNIAFSSVTAIAWISGLQKTVVLNMLHFNDYSFVTEDDSSGILHNWNTGGGETKLSNIYFFLIVIKENLFINIINAKLLLKSNCICSVAFHINIEETYFHMFFIVYVFGIIVNRDNKLKMRTFWLYHHSSLGGIYLHPWAFMDRSVHENACFLFIH